MVRASRVAVAGSARRRRIAVRATWCRTGRCSSKAACASWKTYCTAASRARSRSRTLSGNGVPSRRTVPSWSRWRPARQRASVVLPLPERPTTARHSPAYRSSAGVRSTTAVPRAPSRWRAVRPRTRRTGRPVPAAPAAPSGAGRPGGGGSGRSPRSSRVHACRGERRRRRAGPDSTTRPARRTTTSSASARTTSRSWQSSTTAMPRPATAASRSTTRLLVRAS